MKIHLIKNPEGKWLSELKIADSMCWVDNMQNATVYTHKCTVVDAIQRAMKRYPDIRPAYVTFTVGLKESIAPSDEFPGAYSAHEECEHLLQENVGKVANIVPLGRPIEGPCLYIPLVEYGVALSIPGKGEGYK